MSADGDFDARISKNADAFAADSGIGIDHSAVDFADSRRDDSVGAWWGLAMMAAGFERDEHLGFGSGFAGIPECVDFGVIAAVEMMIAFTDDLSVLDDHRADQRIGSRLSSGSLCQFNRPKHVVTHDHKKAQSLLRGDRYGTYLPA